MNNKIRIPIMPCLDKAMTKKELDFNISIEYVEFDLHTLIKDYRSIIDKIDKNKDKLGYDGLIILSDWLYEWYKKNNHYILSGRILDAHRYALTCADNLRHKVY